MEATAITESPMPNVWVSVWYPYTPGAASTPSKCPVNETVVCAGQKSRGRKSSVELPSQYHAPTTRLEVVSSIDRSTAALSLTGVAEVRMIGMPTP